MLQTFEVVRGPRGFRISILGLRERALFTAGDGAVQIWKSCSLEMFLTPQPRILCTENLTEEVQTKKRKSGPLPQMINGQPLRKFCVVLFGQILPGDCFVAHLLLIFNHLLHHKQLSNLDSVLLPMFGCLPKVRDHDSCSLVMGWASPFFIQHSLKWIPRWKLGLNSDSRYSLETISNLDLGRFKRVFHA